MSSDFRSPKELSYSVNLYTTTDEERGRVIEGTKVQYRFKSTKVGVVLKVNNNEKKNNDGGRSTRRTNSITNVNNTVYVEWLDGWEDDGKDSQFETVKLANLNANLESLEGERWVTNTSKKKSPSPPRKKSLAKKSSSIPPRNMYPESLVRTTSSMPSKNMSPESSPRKSCSPPPKTSSSMPSKNMSPESSPRKSCSPPPKTSTQKLLTHVLSPSSTKVVPLGTLVSNDISYARVASRTPNSADATNVNISGDKNQKGNTGFGDEDHLKAEDLAMTKSDVIDCGDDVTSQARAMSGRESNGESNGDASDCGDAVTLQARAMSGGESNGDEKELLLGGYGRDVHDNDSAKTSVETKEVHMRSNEDLFQSIVAGMTCFCDFNIKGPEFQRKKGVIIRVLDDRKRCIVKWDGEEASGYPFKLTDLVVIFKLDDYNVAKDVQKQAQERVKIEEPELMKNLMTLKDMKSVHKDDDDDNPVSHMEISTALVKDEVKEDADIIFSNNVVKDEDDDNPVSRKKISTALVKDEVKEDADVIFLDNVVKIDSTTEISNFDKLQREYERISVNSWAMKKFNSAGPVFSLLFGCKVLHSLDGIQRTYGHAYRDTLRENRLREDGFVSKSVSKDEKITSDTTCELHGWHLNANFSIKNFVDQLITAFGWIVYKYLVFDYLNSPHSWIRDNWSITAIENLVEMAERGLLQSDSIVEIPYTPEVKQWIDEKVCHFQNEKKLHFSAHMIFQLHFFHLDEKRFPCDVAVD
jgi:hypothetical protein